MSIKLGIIGCGRIAGRFASDAWQGTDTVIAAVYNPRIESAKKFAQEYHIDLATDRWDEFAAQIDAAYIAAPHEQHVRYATRLLQEKKHVLCEKPMAFSGEEARNLYTLAKENDCILLEAVKTAYCPGFVALLELVKTGVIGEIKDVEACFCKLTPTNLREFTNLDLGGSVTELGTYCLLPIIKLFGSHYTGLHFSGVRAENGVDGFTKIMLEYDDGTGLAKMGLGVKSEGELIISGTKGYIYAQAPWWLTKHFEVRYEDPNKRDIYTYPYEGTGLKYEYEAFVQAIETGAMPTVGVTEEESVAIAEIMGRFLQKEQTCRDAARARIATAKPGIWAHRGCSYAYPENTLEAFAAAAKLRGITGIETDVQLTKDGEVVIFHDENLKRLIGVDARLCDYTLEELKRFRIAKGDEKETQIPTLEETLQLLEPYCKEHGLLLNIELKTSIIRYEGIEEKTYELVKKYGLENHVVYSSFLPDSVKRMKELDGQNRTGMLAGRLSDCIRMARETGADALHPYNGGFDTKLPEDFKTKPVRVWNAEEPFYKDGRLLKEKNMPKYSMYRMTDLITNVPELYLS